MFNGMSSVLEINKFSPFRKGSKSGATSRCYGCQGTGMKVTTRHIGMGMFQQMQHVCSDCGGTGKKSALNLIIAIIPFSKFSFRNTFNYAAYVTYFLHSPHL